MRSQLLNSILTPLPAVFAEYSPDFLVSLPDDDDCIPGLVLMLESVGVITVGRGVAGDWANTHQETSLEKNKTEDN